LRDEIRCLSIEADTHVGAVGKRESHSFAGEVNNIDSSWFDSLLACCSHETLAVSVRPDKDVSIVLGLIEVAQDAGSFLVHVVTSLILIEIQDGQVPVIVAEPSSLNVSLT